MILVSIIIPVYNVQEYINDCLASVYTQNYSNLEIIIVDDCSSDESLSIADEWIKLLRSKFPCKVITHKKNKGLSAARNSGIEASNGDYLFFLDSDDELYPDSIYTLVSLLFSSPKGVDFVVGGFEMIGVNYLYPVLSASYMQSNHEILSDYLLNKWPIMACNKLIRRSLVMHYSLWFEDGLLHEDELFSFKLACICEKVCTTNKLTYIYKVRSSGSITSTRGEYHYRCMYKINTQRYAFVRANMGNRIKKSIATSFLINSTYDFVKSVDLNLLNAEKKVLLKLQIDLFLSSIYLIPLIGISKEEYFRVRYVLKKKIMLVFI